jgi:hypothetical protein
MINPYRISREKELSLFSSDVTDPRTVSAVTGCTNFLSLNNFLTPLGNGQSEIRYKGHYWRIYGSDFSHYLRLPTIPEEDPKSFA